MTTVFLQFIDEAATVAAFSQWSDDGTIPAYVGGAAVDVVGTIQRPTGEILKTEDGEIPVLAPVPGWHINLSEPVPELVQYEIEAPAAPARVFAGSGEIDAPRVPAEVARWQAKLALMHQVDGQGVSLWDRLQQLRESLTDAGQQTMLDAAMNEVLNWKRPSPTVLWAAEQLGLTAQQVDELFIYAHALEL
ncbi:hypothetical protein P245_14375 [Comamonas thiooxydans]|uniref:Uncharacterized protein n=1 Tax=Comamonas thiooxydans TaxID=363952 RepID=A0A0E3C1E8_9BURK|nr:hypothetical protein [Comamonas thiooxydans]KGG90953.1 hypothetical protein P245_14375 [Comamonas thiooxydans]